MVDFHSENRWAVGFHREFPHTGSSRSFNLGFIVYLALIRKGLSVVKIARPILLWRSFDFSLQGSFFLWSTLIPASDINLEYWDDVGNQLAEMNTETDREMDQVQKQKSAKFSSWKKKFYSCVLLLMTPVYSGLKKRVGLRVILSCNASDWTSSTEARSRPAFWDIQLQIILKGSPHCLYKLIPDIRRVLSNYIVVLFDEIISFTCECVHVLPSVWWIIKMCTLHLNHWPYLRLCVSNLACVCLMTCGGTKFADVCSFHTLQWSRERRIPLYQGWHGEISD